mgnify:CR=1 FL=1
MSERLPSIKRGIDSKAVLLKANPVATVELPDLTEEEVSEVKELYRDQFGVIREQQESEGKYCLHLGGYRNA